MSALGFSIPAGKFGVSSVADDFSLAGVSSTADYFSVAGDITAPVIVPSVLLVFLSLALPDRFFFSSWTRRKVVPSKYKRRKGGLATRDHMARLSVSNSCYSDFIGDFSVAGDFSISYW